MTSHFRVTPDATACSVLSRYTREDLRAIARRLGVDRGRDKGDTARNLIASGKLIFGVTVAPKPTYTQFTGRLERTSFEETFK